MKMTEKKLCLFQTKSTLNHTSTQTHTEHRFFVPQETTEIQITFNYSPVLVDDQERQSILIEEALKYDKELDPAEVKDVILRNLLTISIDDPDGFRGAAHRSAGLQNIVIGEKEATAGFWKGSIQAGLWSVTVSAHAILTEMCTYELIIEGTGQFADNFDRDRIWRNYDGLENIKANDIEYQPQYMGNAPTRWVAAELHSHTNHSDGIQSLEELASIAKQRGLEVVAVTDHNTTSPLQEKEQVEQETGIRIINGLEWTTFFGHVLTLGYKSPQYSEWRKVGPTDIHRGIREIKALGALVGIAHPFRKGNPFCTGCYFEYMITNLQDFDYIEVWNSDSPSLKRYNQRAFQLWTNLLNKGYHLPAVSGRDWHHNIGDNPLVATTHILVKEESTQEAFEQEMLDAIKQGRLSISYGGPFILTANVRGLQVQIGDCVKVEEEAVTFEVSFPDPSLWHSAIDTESLRLQLESNLGTLYSKAMRNERFSVEGSGLKWARAELWGLIDGQELLVAFTNAIYFE
ncbi:CehA/McbA family metallohydrolase [Ectobacillus polymachus]|uniref:CehA/McbA family metallohydrolase n=1 Tax=Ectobacillus polymachus TaxID=1508806 RepID=UPI003A89CCBF